jgi:hypothetical protein
MCIPGVVGPTLDYHVARPQSRFAAFENERRFSLQETNDVDRMGLMHSWMARLIDDVTSTVKCGKPFARGSVKNRFGYAFRQRTDYEPAHLEIALSGSEHRARGPEIFVGAWRQSPDGRVLPDLEQSAQIGTADFRDEEPPSMIMTDWPWALSPVITRRMAS